MKKTSHITIVTFSNVILPHTTFSMYQQVWKNIFTFIRCIVIFFPFSITTTTTAAKFNIKLCVCVFSQFSFGCCFFCVCSYTYLKLWLISSSYIRLSSPVFFLWILCIVLCKVCGWYLLLLLPISLLLLYVFYSIRNSIIYIMCVYAYVYLSLKCSVIHNEINFLLYWIFVMQTHTPWRTHIPNSIDVAISTS